MSVCIKHHIYGAPPPSPQGGLSEWLAARRNCSKQSLDDFCADDGVEVDFWARLAHEPMFFNFTSC